MDREWLRYIRKMLCKDKCFMMEEKTQKEVAALIDSVLVEPSEIVEHGVVAKECIARYKADPQKAIEQIEWCGYECEGGTIEKSLAWEAIKELLSEPDADADVAEATRDIMDIICECKSLFKSDKKALYLAIAALRQYQKPTDEKISQAIGWQEAQKASAQNDWERAGAEWRMEPGAQEQHDERMAAFDLAIDALRQMRTDPCEWCDKDGPETWNYTRSGKYIPENQPPRNYCPNCGRKLVK